VLAAVWDAHWKGDEKLNPWVEDEYCRIALVLSLLRADDPCLSCEVTDEDAAVVRVGLATWKPT